MWQDIIIAVGNVALAGVLLPTVADSAAAVPRWTSVPTAAVLYTFAATFATMGLTLSAIAALLSAILWSAIALWRAP